MRPQELHYAQLPCLCCCCDGPFRERTRRGELQQVLQRSQLAAAADAAVMSSKQQLESCVRMYASTWMCPAPAAALQEHTANRHASR
jgi:hypothetical protein